VSQMSKDHHSEPAKLCFVIGPIGKPNSEPRVHADWLLYNIIKPVMAHFPNFRVKRADEDPRPGLIDAQMINDLLTADLVIADLSFLNPNAFYEIGIRHMAQKPIVHMQRDSEDIPFDLSLYRAVKFSLLQYQQQEEAKSALHKSIEAVLAEHYEVENPVTNARGKIHLLEHATPELKVLTDEVDALRNRLDSIELTAMIAQGDARRALGSPPHLNSEQSATFFELLLKRSLVLSETQPSESTEQTPKDQK
jgi:hypothetical protein